MASEELSSPTTSSKHRRSSDDHGAEASSKRRKHHHHHHRRRHRHRSRHGRMSEDGAEDASLAVDAAAADASADPMPVDDEREEGEIFEEDEGQAIINGGQVIDESGELKPVGVANSNLIMYGTEDTSRKGLKILTHNQKEDFDENMLDPAQSCENSTWNDEARLEGDKLDGDTTTEKDENISHTILEKNIEPQEEARRRQSKSLELKENKHRLININESKIQVRSRSLSSHSFKHKEKDGLEDRGSGSDSEMLDSRQHMELRDAGRRASDSNRSISPKDKRDKYRDTRNSPFSNRYHDDDQHRNRPWSHDRSKRHSCEKILQYSADDDDHVSSRGNIRDDSGRYHRLDSYAPRNRACDKELHNERETSGSRIHDDRHGSREKDREREKNSSCVKVGDNMDLDKGARRERERSSSYNRYDSREDKHSSRGRDRERERNSSSVRERENMDLYKGGRTERESSCSYSRYDRREDRHELRDRERGRERNNSSINDRVRDKASDIRDSYVERERLRDSRLERERHDNDRDKNRAKDRDASVHKGRNQGGQLEIDRHSSRDRLAESRHSKHHEVGRHKDKLRSKESGSHIDNPEDKQKYIREEEDYQEKIEQQLAKQDEGDVDKIKEESRRRRQAILEKYRQKQEAKFLSDGNINAMEKATSDKEKLEGLPTSNADGVANNEEIENMHDSGDASDVDPSFTVGKSPAQTGDSANKTTNNVGGLGEGSPKSERSADMFSDDIFGESPAGVCKTGKGEGPQIDKSSLYDNWDDAEGYYSYRFGEVLDGRYEVVAAHGKGVFSTVVRAKDLKAGKGDPEEVAIKIIRNNETMYKAGQDELVILKKLAGADPEDKRHCVRFLSSFKYRNHLCLVFESLHMNLREVLKKFGRNIGLKLTAVRAYAKQLFIALKHLRNCGVLHCDIKPDNMLVNEAKNVLKLCDFGNAMFAGKNEITPYLVSRFYRAPEIILGLQYDHPMDMWSVGCCLYELYTGKVLFPGPSNNDMLRLQMELKGSFPKKMLRKAAFADQHFDQDLNFHATEEDPVTKKPIKRLLLNIKPRDIGALISTFPGEDPKLLSNFKDLLDRIFVLDPEKRMTVSQALGHPFITGK